MRTPSVIALLLAPAMLLPLVPVARSTSHPRTLATDTTPTAQPTPITPTTPTATPTTPSPTTPAPRPDWAAFRAATDEAMKRLEPLIGEWTVVGTMGRPDEQGRRVRQSGTWSNRWIMDGRHLELNFDVTITRPDGTTGRSLWMAIVSYNAFRHQYETTWISSSGYRFAETGNFDDQGRLVLTSVQDGPDLSNLATNLSIFEFHDDATISVIDTQTDRETPDPIMSFEAYLTRAE